MNIGIILAGGSSIRFGDDTPKQFLILHGRRVLDYSIKTFEDNKHINKIIIVVPKKWKKIIQDEYSKHNIIIGGNSRRESSYNALKVCPKKTKNVLIHDAARPFVDNTIIFETICSYCEQESA